MKIFPTGRSLTPSIKKTTSKTKLVMEGWPTGKTLGGSPILIPTGEEDSIFLVTIGEGVKQVLMNIG